MQQTRAVSLWNTSIRTASRGMPAGMESELLEPDAIMPR